MTSYPEIRGRLAVVTGAASGIGAAVAEALAVEGADIALVDIDEAGARRLAGTLAADFGVATHPLGLDISDSAAVSAAVEALASRAGAVHYLVNCAASFVAAGAEATDDQWDRALSVNVRGTARMLSACLPHMSDGGSVVNVSSVSAHVAQPDRWTYNATKGAIVSLTRCQALDLAPRSIRVNCVSPGWIWTPEVERAAGSDRERLAEVWSRFHMLARLGAATEVADAVVFLCSNRASFITGTELAVDGGYLGMSAEGAGGGSTFAGSD